MNKNGSVTAHARQSLILVNAQNLTGFGALRAAHPAWTQEAFRVLVHGSTGTAAPEVRAA
jgi:hypothetical protein